MRPEIETITLPGELSFELVRVEGGEFMMGGGAVDERSIHKVRVDNFSISRFPVTQRLYSRVTGKSPSFFKGNDRPVEKVSWNDAQMFIQKLNKKTGRNFRLPTEAEWEYAARGGNKSKGFKYAGSDKLNEVGWFRGNSYFETKPVGLKLPNELGLYDMSGNVWEWCQDWFGSNYYQECLKQGVVIDPKGPEEGTSRVMRGGSYFDYSEGCRSANRGDYLPEYRYHSVGFRLVAPCRSGG